MKGGNSGNGKHLNLEERAGDKRARHFNGSDSRRSLAEKCRPHLAVLGKLAHIGHVGADIYHIGEGGAVTWAPNLTNPK